MANLLRTVQEALSPERLGPYREAAAGDPWKTIALYEWNAAISGALWVDVGHLEVVLRNAISAQLVSWNISKHGDGRWYLDPAKALAPQRIDDIATACRRIQRDGRTETVARVLTELPFGFWRYLMSSRYDWTIWRACVREAFPGQQTRRRVYDELVKLHELRNRIAHHEPVHNRPLASLHQSLLRVVEWISPELRGWLVAQSTFESALNELP